jgi:hypothetical protein
VRHPKDPDATPLDERGGGERRESRRRGERRRREENRDGTVRDR